MQKERQKIWKLLFLIYILVLIKLIVFKYPLAHLRQIMEGWKKEVILEGLSTANFTLGRSIRMYIRYFDKFPFWNGFANLVGNILVFIPYGFLLPQVYPACSKWWRVLYCAAGFVMAIELFQLCSAFGVFDVDDILLNVSGAMAGYGLFYLKKQIVRRKKVKKLLKRVKI